jgi:tyrosyl-tRNA synthetase
MNSKEKEEIIQDILTRGVEDVFVKESLVKKLKSDKKLVVKFGIDPTGPKIHLGRAVVLRKLKKFQELGHKVILIIGDFTAQIGDPSDKLGKRPMLDAATIKKNLKDYKKSLGKIIDLRRTTFKYNSKWLSKLNLKELALLAESFSVQQMLARRNFKDRYESQGEISLREFLYPIMQGYDSVKIKSDVEIGGFDQLFNLKAGRIIQRHYGQPEQDVLTCQMLEGTDGRKMSTSWGNVINITDEPNDMFGKVMSMRDDLIGKYFSLTTDLSPEEIKEIQNNIGLQNPRDLKMRLAWEIVKLYHGDKEADKAKNFFVTAFQKKEIPADIKIIKTTKGALLMDILLKNNLVKSKSDFRRLVAGGGLSEINGEKITEPTAKIEKDVTLKIGKKNFLKIELK